MRPKTTTSSVPNAAMLAIRARNRAFITEVNARTFCAHCGAQPVEWHNPEHVELNRQAYRISSLVVNRAAIKTIQTEMARCTPLCRRCHMAEDGRLEALRQANPLITACVECTREAPPLRKGLCSRCYDRKRRPAGVKTRIVATHCKQGHALVDGNIHPSKDGRRRCWICVRARKRKYYAAQKGGCGHIWSPDDE